MTPDESERLNELCALIAKERGHAAFMDLVLELSDLLERRQSRLEPAPAKPDPTL
jgi:hypothetical protein